MKIRVVRGEYSIEVEGSAPEVREAMDAYWLAVPTPGQSEVAAPAKPVVTKRTQRPKKQTGSASPRTTKTKWDPMPLVDAVKALPDYKDLEREVLFKRDRWNQCRLVLSQSTARLTSGQIASVLEQLRVKVAQQRVSEALIANTSDLQHDKITKGAKVAYGLTGQAVKDWDAYRKSLNGSK